MGQLKNTLSKEERLHSKNDINKLLAEGKFGSATTLKYCFRTANGLSYNRILVSVPKRLFKRAVKRNLLKRRLRESYRLQKQTPGLEQGVDIMFIYNTKTVLPFTEIYETVGQILTKISDSNGERKN